MSEPTPVDRPLSELSAEEKAARSGVFGDVATHYERFRPGPPAAAVDWFLPERVHRVVDLGAGTGALSRLLVDRADEVVAVEPDERMRTVLAGEVPQIRVVDGRGEATGLPDDSADAVLASSSWHWMDPARALAEAARILVPGGTLGAVWSGPDPDGAFVAQARALLSRGAPTDGDGGDGDRQSGESGGESGDGRGDGSGDNGGGESDAELASVVNGDGNRPVSALEVPDGGPFPRPDHQVIRWDVALDADDIVGLLGTFSWVITMPEAARQRVFDQARRLLREHLGVEGDVTVDVGFRAECWRTRYPR
jgi:SAM-dependent methyltransferase